MKIYVFGSTGMLGRYVSTYLGNDHNSIPSKFYEVRRITRNDLDITQVTESILEKFLRPKSDDIVINCAGTVKPRVDELGSMNAILANSLFPHRLSSFCEKFGIKMIHITTDCVFSGERGSYTEEDKHDVCDVYGRTKSLGEPDNCTVIRTSIIGEEFNQTRSLIEWVKSRRDKDANGFTNHYWNGVTCLQLSKIIGEMIDRNIFWNGVRNIYSPNSVNKYELLNIINKVYDLNIDISSVEAKDSIDRTLSSKYSLNFEIPALEKQIEEMKKFFGN